MLISLAYLISFLIHAKGMTEDISPRTIFNRTTKMLVLILL